MASVIIGYARGGRGPVRLQNPMFLKLFLCVDCCVPLSDLLESTEREFFIDNLPVRYYQIYWRVQKESSLLTTYWSESTLSPAR